MPKETLPDLHQCVEFASNSASFASIAVGEDWNQLFWQTLLRQRVVLVSDPDAAWAILQREGRPVVYQAPLPATDGDPDFHWTGNQFMVHINFSAQGAQLMRSGFVWAPRVPTGPDRGCQRQPPATRAARMLRGVYFGSVQDPTSAFTVQEDWRNLDVRMYREFVAKTPNSADSAYSMNTLLYLSRALEGK